MLTKITEIAGYTVIEIIEDDDFGDIVTYDDLIDHHHQALLDAQKD